MVRNIFEWKPPEKAGGHGFPKVNDVHKSVAIMKYHRNRAASVLFPTSTAEIFSRP